MPTLYWKLIGGAVGALLLGVLVASWMARGREIARLTEWQDTVVQATTAATVEPDKNGKRKLLLPTQVPAAIAALKSSFDSADQALAAISYNAQTEKAISDKLDANLAAILSSQDKTAAGINSTVKALQAHKGTGDKTADCAVMTVDSSAAWDGWRPTP
jgi:hypothetical protein